MGGISRARHERDGFWSVRPDAAAFDFILFLFIFFKDERGGIVCFFFLAEMSCGKVV